MKNTDGVHMMTKNDLESLVNPITSDDFYKMGILHEFEDFKKSALWALIEGIIAPNIIKIKRAVTDTSFRFDEKTELEHSILLLGDSRYWALKFKEDQIKALRDHLISRYPV